MDYGYSQECSDWKDILVASNVFDLMLVIQLCVAQKTHQDYTCMLCTHYVCILYLHKMLKNYCNCRN